MRTGWSVLGLLVVAVAGCGMPAPWGDPRDMPAECELTEGTQVAWLAHGNPMDFGLGPIGDRVTGRGVVGDVYVEAEPLIPDPGGRPRFRVFCVLVRDPDTLDVYTGPVPEEWEPPFEWAP